MATKTSKTVEQFFDVIKRGKYETVQQLLDEANSKERRQELSDSVNKNGETGLFLAIKLGPFAIAVLLLENGASFEITDNFGTSLPQLCINYVNKDPWPLFVFWRYWFRME